MGKIDTGGRPLLMTQEVLGVLTSGSELQDNAIFELDKSQHLMIEDHEDAPTRNFANTRAAQRFRELLEHNYPGITRLMDELPHAAEMKETADGRRRLLLAGMAHWMRSHNQDPIIGADHLGLLEYFDSQGFDTWESHEIESKMQLENQPKQEFDQQQFDQASNHASNIEAQRTKSQLLRKSREQKIEPPDSSNKKLTLNLDDDL